MITKLFQNFKFFTTIKVAFQKLKIVNVFTLIAPTSRRLKTFLISIFKKIISAKVITIIKFRFIILCFMVIYSIFLLVGGYLLYQSFYLALNNLNDFVYNNMTESISNLNYNYPIDFIYNRVPSVSHINNVYNTLGIINYNDYIFRHSHNSQVLHSILNTNPQLQSNVSSIVLADIVYQNSQLFADIAEEFLKRYIRLSLPLIISMLLFGSTYALEIISACDTGVLVQC